jgi:hypothetical protein
MSNNNGGSLVLKALGWLVVAFVAIFIVKMVFGAILGFFSLLMTLVLILVMGYAVVWVLRKL